MSKKHLTQTHPSAGSEFRLLECWLGPIAYVARRGRVIAVRLPECPSYPIASLITQLKNDFPNLTENNTLMPDFADQLAAYFAGTLRTFSVATAAEGAAFSQSVWKACRSIAFGKTTTYGDLARKIDEPTAARAVGQALHHNPLPLIVPCHRVLTASGKLGGFACGVAVKQRLLDHEHQCVNYHKPLFCVD
jgi:methylated-DNA-[protein]-cysteine S-methyltransferase